MKQQTLPDGGQINRSDIEAMRAWSEILGVQQVEILVAVAAVGPWYRDVRRYLQVKFCFSSREAELEAGHPFLETSSFAA